jgi:hypothetical protein
MIDISGIKPEELAALEHIDKAKKTLKDHTKDLKKLDKKGKSPKKK